MSAQEHHEYMIGWDLYQHGHSDINVCTSMLQRRGWLAARAAEAASDWQEAQDYVARELAHA